jgi:hypothetical protein
LTGLKPETYSKASRDPFFSDRTNYSIARRKGTIWLNTSLFLGRLIGGCRVPDPTPGDRTTLKSGRGPDTHRIVPKESAGTRPCRASEGVPQFPLFSLPKIEDPPQGEWGPRGLNQPQARTVQQNAAEGLGVSPNPPLSPPKNGGPRGLKHPFRRTE